MSDKKERAHAKHFFLNERHELTKIDKTGGGSDRTN